MFKQTSMRFTHLGIYVRDLRTMVEFYTREFGLLVTDEGIGSTGPRGAFLTGDPAEHHQLVFVEGRDETSKPTTNQISFLIEDLAALRTYAKHCVEDGIPVLLTKNHGNAWSIYIKDPDGNTVEVYCHSPWYIPQPCGKPLDLSASESEILEQTEVLVRATPGWMTREEWLLSMKERLK